MKDEKRTNDLLRWSNQSQEKIKFLGFWEEKCNCVWAKRLTRDLYKCDCLSRWRLFRRKFHNVWNSTLLLGQRL